MNDSMTHQQYLLAKWQADRLARTYADLNADARYQPATQFFLSDLYGPYDFSQRDKDGERVLGVMHRFLPDSALQPIQMAIELNHLTHELDAAMVKTLFDVLKVGEEISEADYAKAYRLCDNQAKRHQQIETVFELGCKLDRVVRKPFVQMALKLAHRPARAAGLGELQDFIERGFSAFLHMSGADFFLNTIRQRELQILERIYTDHPAPFALDELLLPAPDESA